MAHNITEKDGKRFVSVFFPGLRGRSAPEGHVNFDKIIAALEADPTDTSVMELFEVAPGVTEKFEGLSERISVRNGTLFLDGAVTDNVLSQQIVRFLYDGVDDFKPLVKFYENILANPNEHSRTQLFSWLNQHKFVIDEDGYLIGYKAVYRTATEGVYRANNRGYAVVDGVEYTNEYTPYHVGAVVTMPRHMVNHNPSEGCSTGLHVGTFNYASSFIYDGATMRVKVNPRDVVSVPTHCDWAKVRCCRLEVIEINAAEFQEPLAYYGRPELDEPVRLIPASEWQAENARPGDFVAFEIDGDHAVEPCTINTHEVGHTLSDDWAEQESMLGGHLTEAPIRPLGSFLDEDSADDTPRIDSYTTHPHGLREPDSDPCGHCGSEWCEYDECMDDDLCSECSQHYDDCLCAYDTDW